MVSCKTKHKVIERETVKEATKKEASVSTINQNDVVTNTNINIGSDIIKISSIKEIQLTQSDSSKTITITDDTGKTLSIKGADAIIKTTEAKETKKDTLNQKVSEIDKSKTTNLNNSKESTKKDNTKRKAESDVKTTSTWLWILLIIGVGLLIYFKRRKIVSWF